MDHRDEVRCKRCGAVILGFIALVMLCSACIESLEGVKNFHSHQETYVWNYQSEQSIVNVGSSTTATSRLYRL